MGPFFSRVLKSMHEKPSSQVLARIAWKSQFLSEVMSCLCGLGLLKHLKVLKESGNDWRPQLFTKKKNSMIFLIFSYKLLISRTRLTRVGVHKFCRQFEREKRITCHNDRHLSGSASIFDTLHPYIINLHWEEHATVGLDWCLVAEDLNASNLDPG